MAKSVHEQWHVIHRDFIPEGQEYTAPHSGGLFHDFIPEGKRGIDMHGLTYDATPPQPVDEPAGEDLQTIVVIPDTKPKKSDR